MSFLSKVKKAAEFAFKTVYPADAKFTHPDSLTLIAAFLAIPNQIPKTAPFQTIKNLAQNFFGLRDDIIRQNNWRKKLLILPFILWNLVLLPVNLVINGARIFTEFLPLFFSQLFNLYAKKLLLFSKDQQIKHPWRTAASDLLKFLGLIFNAIYLAGRCLTSPILSVQLAWQYGFKFKTSKIVGALFGCIFSACSISFTTLIVAWLLPGILTLLFGKAVITSLNQAVGLLASIGKLTASYMSFLVNLTAEPVLIGCSVVLSLMITIPGTLLDVFIITPFKNWWNEAIFIYDNKNATTTDGASAQNSYAKLLTKLGFTSDQTQPKSWEAEDDWLLRMEFSEEEDSPLSKEWLEFSSEEEVSVDEKYPSMLTSAQKF